ncbi:hypothetical protein [Roseateles sp.]|uniref:hypothetical protein n=1 Tax=Roseateles sp. TaxID=1971397 RepID=UPI003BA56367
MTLLTLLMISAGCSHSWAQTQTRTSTLYRCGPDGRDLRDSPCPSSLRASESTVQYDQPSAAQTQAAKQQAAAELKRALAMEKARLKQEAEARRHLSSPTGIDGLKPIPAVIPASAPKATNSAKPPKPPKAQQVPKPKPQPAQPKGSESTNPGKTPKSPAAAG